MSRNNNRSRRLARRARSSRSTVGQGSSGPLTQADRDRVLQRFGSLRGRSGVRFGFQPVFADGWVDASTPDQLDDAVRQRLSSGSDGDSN